eukprot:c14644_g1_i1 orf=313-1029(-)
MAEVSSYPLFPGLEENYLRAQIARISANTVLAPNGYYKITEAEEEESSENIEKNEEWVMPPPAELGKLDAWVHQNPHLKKQGRCSFHVLGSEEQQDSQEDEEMEEETPKTEEEMEQSPKLLTSINNDDEIADGMKPWSIRCSSSIHSLKHQIVCLRSLLWPGANVVATKDGFSNVYIGWGLKNCPYEPPMPPELQKEYDGELIECQELPPIPKPEVFEEPAESEAEHGGEAESEEGEE